MFLLFLFLILIIGFVVSVCKIIGSIIILGFFGSSATKYEGVFFPKSGVLYPYPRKDIVFIYCWRNIFCKWFVLVVAKKLFS